MLNKKEIHNKCYNWFYSRRVSFFICSLWVSVYTFFGKVLYLKLINNTVDHKAQNRKPKPTNCPILGITDW